MMGMHGWHELVPENPKAGLLIVHGIAEHGARYRHVPIALAGHDIAVFIYDQRGHGVHPGKRTDVERFSDFADDLEATGVALRDRFPTLPLFVWGHSMGSVIVTLAAIDRLRWARGIITTGHALDALPNLDGLLGRILGTAAALAPKWRLSLGIDATKLTQLVEIQRGHMADPLVPRSASLRLLFGFAQACQVCREHLSELTQPWLVVHGEADTVCPPSGSQSLFTGLGSSDKQLVMYPTLLHEIHNEGAAARDAFFVLLSRWILERSAPV
jgi:alpha-beta hydrolase superfamily lysophospholipase